MIARKRIYTSARDRLMKLADFGPFFEGRHAMQVFDWSPKTAAHYLWLWAQQGLVRPLGGKSDVFFNLVADRAAESRIEAAIRRVMPGAVVGPLNVLNESGLTTQRPGTLQLLVRPDERQLTIVAAQVESRPPTWWSAIDLANGVEPGTEESLARLTQGAAIADSALSPGGPDPDDIDFEAVKLAERRRAVKILRMLSPMASPSSNLEGIYTAAWSARRKADERRRLRVPRRARDEIRKK